MANNETRTLKTNTFEEWRQKTNEQSFELGDVDQLDSRILDKNYTYTAAVNQAQFTGTDTGSKALRFEQAPEEAVDMLHVVIFTGSPTIPSNFVAGATCTQSGGFSGKILWINKNKAAFSTVSGIFNAAQNLIQGSQNIPNANLHSTLSESVKVGYSRVKVQGTEISQSQVQAGWHIPNYSLKVVTTGAPTIPTEWVEGVTLTQSGGFSGTLLYADTSVIRFKTYTGSFNVGQNLVLSSDNTKKVLASGLTSIQVQDTTYENIIELHTLSSASDAIIVIANSAINAINEVQDDLGDITSLGTTDKADIVTAVNELETGVRGSSASLIASGLTTTANDLLAAANEHDAELGTITAGAMGTSASTVSTAIAEHEAQIGNVAYGTTAQTLSGGINELDDELGTISAAAMGTTASTVGPAILELETEIDVLNARVEPTQAFAGTFTATTVMDALNEHETDIGSMSFTGSGTTIGGTSTSLTTALNALDTEIGDTDSYNDGTYGAITIAGTLDLLQAGMIANDTDIAARLIKSSGSSQTLATDLSLGGNKTYTVTSGSTLDVSNGTLLLPGNASGVNTFSVSFLNVDGNQASTGMGMRIDRAHISSSPTPYPAIQWRESQVGASKGHRGWQIVGTNAAGNSSVTSDLVTFYNAEELFTNNVETGLGFAWDSTNQNFDVTLDNSTFALTGDVTGSVTQTAKGNVSIATTIAANSVALGTDTTGNYMSGISGTANEITVTHTPGEGSSATVALPDDVTIGNNLTVTDYTRTAGLRVGTSGTDPGDGVLAVASNATIGGNLTVTGNFTVNGTTTTLSTTNLEVEDTLILAGSDLGSTEPTSGGFGLETKPFAGVHSPAAAGVTGAHSLVYNFATDQWEADGSLVLSSATNTPPTIESNTFGAGKNLDFINGSGITVGTTTSGNDIDVTVTNTDKGSSQYIFKNVAPSSGTTATADVNADTLNITQGGGITTVGSGDNIITINHADTSSQASVDNANGTVIQDITLDTYGHTTGLASVDLDGRYYRENEFASANTASAPVIRDGSGNFSAGTITANLTGTASQASNAGTLDNIDSTSFLRSDAADSFSGSLSMGTQKALVASDYGHGVYGVYSATKYQHVWGMGTAYNMHPSGNNITGFYGMAWTHSNNSDGTWAGGHQLLIVTNGTVTAAVGDNLWTTGTVTASGGNSGEWNSAYDDTNAATNANTASRIVKRDGSGNFLAGTITADVTGDLTGNADTATQSDKIQVTAAGDVNIDLKLMLTDSSASTNDNSSVWKHTGLYYNPLSDKLFASYFSGRGDHLTHLDATNISSGTISDARLPATITSNITGDVTGDVSGNAGTVTNGVYTTGNQTIAGTKTFSSTVGFVASQSANAKWLNTDNNTQTRILFTVATADGSGPIYHSGGLTVNSSSNIFYATDFVASSDERLKIKVGTLDNALDKICSLDGFLYTWNDKAESEDKETVQVGVSAQQVQEVLPEAVDEGDDGYLGVKYDKLVPLLIESIKELKAEVEELKSINR